MFASLELKCKILIFLLIVSISGTAQEWDHQLEGQVIRSYAINPWNTDILLIGTKSFAGDGRVYISQDAGNSWMATNNNKPLSDSTEDVQAVAFLNDSTYLAGCWKTGLYISRDRGKNFERVKDFPSSDIRAIKVDPKKPEKVWLGTTTHGVIRSEDGLKSWILQTGDKQASWDLELDHTKPNTLYSCLYDGGLGKSKDDGNSFKPLHKKEGIMVYDVLVHYDGRTWAVGGGDSTEFFLYRAFNGSGWKNLLLDVDYYEKANYSCVHEVDGTVYVGSWDKGLLTYTDGQWDSIPEVDAATITKIDYANNFLYVFTWGNGIYRQKKIVEPTVVIGDSLDVRKRQGWFWKMTSNMGIREMEMTLTSEDGVKLYSSSEFTNLRKLGNDIMIKFRESKPASGEISYHCSVTFTNGNWKQFKGKVVLPPEESK